MPDLASRKILVLDDEPFMIKLVVKMLTNLGFLNVETATSAREALKRYAQNNDWPELILVDLQMPEMDGVEFVRNLANSNFAGNVILMSGEDERMLHSVRALVQAHHIKALGYLHKPLVVEYLVRLLNDWQSSAQSAIRTPKKIYAPEALDRALAAGHLLNHYQPKVDLATGAVVGVETLVRWQHEDDGLVFPDQFIGVAETHGLIDRLTRSVLSEALAQTRRWHLAGLNLRVAVNVSMDNLTDLSFVDFVTQEALRAGVPPQQVVLEVTESRLMQDQRTPLEILARLRMKRFRLSIDDFGTGHSSLAQLAIIPFDELKIDQSFVHGAHYKPTPRAIVLATLGLAERLTMEVVAEGVEDRADWDFLCAHGAGLAQGYFIAKPMPPEVLTAWMSDWSDRVKNEGLCAGDTRHE